MSCPESEECKTLQSLLSQLRGSRFELVFWAHGAKAYATLSLSLSLLPGEPEFHGSSLVILSANLPGNLNSCMLHASRMAFRPQLPSRLSLFFNSVREESD